MKPPCLVPRFSHLPAQETLLFNKDGEGGETEGDDMGDANLPEEKSANR